MSNQRALRVHYVTTIVRRAQIICSRVVFGTIIFVWKKCSKTTLKNQIFAYLVTRWIFAKVAFILPWAESTSADKESIRIAWSSSSLPIARDICFNWPTKQNRFYIFLRRLWLYHFFLFDLVHHPDLVITAVAADWSHDIPDYHIHYFETY